MTSAQTNNSKITIYVLSCWIFAAFGGLMFGYDIGISGGVSRMDDPLMKFFPHVYERKLHAKENNYCKYDDQLLQLFTSSLYLSALIASFFASKAATKLGRRPTIEMVIFQQFTGINAIMFYAPVLFQTMGFKTDGSLLSSVITGLVNVGNTFVSIYLIDKVGRRKLLLQACCQMLISQVQYNVHLQNYA
ncbi:sugar transport protein 8-like [Lycium barbarum]|uniref:sugar transport protein 8-like n=1 Tax=Lycium barbarum TaxID=112863 RepID=UPI00293EF57C|nr:sugar transport protein 8-like [Lycium barbarum]